MATQFTNVSDLKKQPTSGQVGDVSGAGGFPPPVQAQMKNLKPPRRKPKYPTPEKPMRKKR